MVSIVVLLRILGDELIYHFFFKPEIFCWISFILANDQ